jgi:hypothetical protein
LLGRCSTTQATPPALFALVIFEMGSYFIPGPDWTTVLLFVVLCVAGMTGTYIVPSHWLRWRLSELLAQACLKL